jgi:glycosyltransferase involved in cell wall biosynthesis
MRIWLVKIGETLPVGQDDKRLLRTGLLSKALANDGHDVLWWTSTFDHFKKKQLFKEDTDFNYLPNLRISLLFGKSYKRNVSIDRIQDHEIISEKFKKRIEEETNKPDIIVCSYPTIGLAYQCIIFGKKYNIPVLIDIRDLWPDIFIEELLPRPLRFLALKTYNLLFTKHQYVFKNADGIIGITESILNWGLHYANRKATKKDKVFHLSYDKSELVCSKEQLESLEKKGLTFDKSKLYVCLIGTISDYKFFFKPIIEAAKLLINTNKEIKFIICGDGEGLERLKKSCKGLNNIVFTGWIDHNEINCILTNSNIGIAPYHNTFTYLTSIPSKISEYFAYGMPVVSGLGGILGNYLKMNNAGYFYHSGQELAEQLIALKNNPELLLRIRENTVALFAKEFDSRFVYENFKKHILSINKNQK